MVPCERRMVVLDEMDECLGRERESQVRFLEGLGEFDAEKWFAFDAYSSTFAFLIERMGFCSHAAWRRLTVARAARKFPSILEMLRCGDVHMTGVAMISKWLDEERGETLLRSIVGKSKRQIEVLIADMDPKPIGDSKVEATSPGGSGEGTTPLGAGNWKVELYANAKLKALIDEALELMPPGTDLSVVVEQALSTWVQKKRARKFGAAPLKPSSPSTPSAPPSVSATRRARYIPSSIRRAVHDRDGGQCSFVDPSGRRCSERSGLEFDHIDPYCLGGAHSVGNLRLLCSAHNRHAAAESLGRAFMKRWYGSAEGEA